MKTFSSKQLHTNDGDEVKICILLYSYDSRSNSNPLIDSCCLLLLLKKVMQTMLSAFVHLLASIVVVHEVVEGSPCCRSVCVCSNNFCKVFY